MGALGEGGRRQIKILRFAQDDSEVPRLMFVD
jgi:hypothetical protein